MRVDRVLQVAYLAPGTGLGHLNRAIAICRCLRDRLGVAVVQIVTDSPYAPGIAARMRFPVTRVRRCSMQSFWRSTNLALLSRIRFRLTFADPSDTPISRGG
jgi:UDP:flavonoid glycosyltransferase YjiC (YdhE family)